jgi:hypothetical protein
MDGRRRRLGETAGLVSLGRLDATAKQSALRQKRKTMTCCWIRAPWVRVKASSSAG